MLGMKSIVSIGVAALAIAAPAMAQSQRNQAPVITVGQVVQGRVAGAQASCNADTPGVRNYRFEARAGMRAEITMTADDFDTVLEIGRLDDCEFQSLGVNDDGAGAEDGLNSRLTVRFPEAGTYIIRAKSFQDSAGGDFTLRVAELPALAGAPTPTPVTAGRTVGGAITNSDAIIEEATASGLPMESILESTRAYDLYSISGEAGQVYVIRVESDEFDPTVDVGTMSPLGFSSAAYNDDGGLEDDGLNSRLEITFRTAGTLLIRVAPLGNDTGEYKLTVENGATR
jgi:hypothetical protein